jgi:hypothetical protein
MTTSNRIYYAVQAVGIRRPVDQGGTYDTGNAPDFVQGLQSVGMNTNFNLEPIYQLGQIQLYDNYEEIPEVEIQLNKVLDGTPTLYSLTMNSGAGDGVATTLASLANTKCGFVLQLYPDVDTNASGTPTAVVECCPAYLSSVSYTFPTEGNFTEEVSLVSNDKTWINTGYELSDELAPKPTTNERGILRRGLWDNTSVLPTGLAGSTSLRSSVSGGLPSGVKISSVKVSMNLGREQIRTLGQRTPYYRYIKFPVEVSTDIEVTANEQGDAVGATQAAAACTNPKALANKEIIVKLCDGTVIDLGKKNKLTTVNYTGGDTGGGNATITYSYRTYSEWTYTGPTGVAVD